MAPLRNVYLLSCCNCLLFVHSMTDWQSGAPRWMINVVGVCWEVSCGLCLKPWQPLKKSQRPWSCQINGGQPFVHSDADTLIGNFGVITAITSSPKRTCLLLRPTTKTTTTTITTILNPAPPILRRQVAARAVGAGHGTWGWVSGRDFSHWTLGQDMGHGEGFRVGTSHTGLLPWLYTHLGLLGRDRVHGEGFRVETSHTGLLDSTHI